MVKMRLAPLAAGMVSPYGRSMAASNHSRKSVPYLTVPSELVDGLPSSSVQMAARSSFFALTRSDQRWIR